MMTEMQRPGSPAIASISHEVALYGPRLMDLGLALLRGETVAPYNYVEHRAIPADWAGKMQQNERSANGEKTVKSVKRIAQGNIPL